MCGHGARRDFPLPLPLRSVAHASSLVASVLFALAEDLSERTIFMHGRTPSFGYFTPGKERGGHLLLNVSVLDYLMAGGGGEAAINFSTFMPITMRTDSNLTMLSLRSTFADLEACNDIRCEDRQYVCGRRTVG